MNLEKRTILRAILDFLESKADKLHGKFESTGYSSQTAKTVLLGQEEILRECIREISKIWKLEQE